MDNEGFAGWYATIARSTTTRERADQKVMGMGMVHEIRKYFIMKFSDKSYQHTS